MTTQVMPTVSGLAPDRPQRRQVVSLPPVLEAGGSVLAGFALVWLVFAIAGIHGPFGFALCCMGAFFVLYTLLSWRLHGILVAKDRLATVAIWTGAFSAFVPLVWVIGYVILQGGAVVLAHFPHFLTADFSGYTGTAPVTAVGSFAAIVGSVEQVGLATIFTVPLGILAATYLASNRNTFALVVGSVVDAMVGMPAIIAGLFVYYLWVLPQKTNGQSGVACAFALSVIMLPIVIRAAQEVISIVPPALTEASYALGGPRWRTLLRVVLPTARVGLVTATILGIARVAGETAPVLLVGGGNPKTNWNPFSGIQDDLPLRIYQMIFQPGVNATRDAWGVSFVLVLVIFVLFALARLIGKRSSGARRLSQLLPFQRRPFAAED